MSQMARCDLPGRTRNHGAREVQTVSNADLLARLESWYVSNCDGDWEHQRGLKIGTLDNPGWAVEIDLAGTELEDERFSELRRENNENDWYRCWVEGNVFFARGAGRNLRELLTVFLDWVQSKTGASGGRNGSFSLGE